MKKNPSEPDQRLEKKRESQKTGEKRQLKRIGTGRIAKSVREGVESEEG